MNKLLLFLTVLFFIPFTLLAQNKTIKGKVVDESGNPIAGVNVTATGTSKATQTDKDGNFSITVSGTVQLTFTSVGYTAKTVSPGSNETLSVQMQKEVSTMEDVVIIGYQTVKRKDLLASVSSVGAKDLKDIPINSAAEALNGRLAGVTATTSEGSPDADIKIRVRGGMSITGDNTPLYIVDGIQVENGLSAISPQDIQTIDVLKDAAATAIYGARAANGVIIITTKSGKPGKLRISYNGYVGVKFLAKKLKVLDPYDYVIYQSERSRGSSSDSTTFLNNFGTTWDTLNVYRNIDKVDWQGEVFGNTGVMQTHNLALSGGTKKITYSFGYTYNDDKAVVLNSNYKRHLLNLKADYKITKNIKAGVGMRYTHQDVQGAGVSSETGTSYNRLRNAVKYRPFLSPNQLIDEPDPIADPNVGNGLILVNPIQLANAEYRKKSRDIFNINANVSWNILKNLTFKTTVGYDLVKGIDRQFSDSIAPYSITQGGAKPIVRLDSTEAKTFTNSNVLTYSLNLRKKHSIDILVGEETYELKTETRSSLFGGYPTFTPRDVAIKQTSLGAPFTGYPKLGKTRYTSLSFFGRVNYSFMDKYLVSVNIREDGASKFGPGNKWGTFPAASVAWRVSKEKFMENVSFINDLKLRVGFGSIGNNRIDDYLYLTTFSNNGNYYYGLNGTSINAYYSTSLVNPKLKWESTINRNFGLDLTILNRRLDLSADYYYNTSSDLLLNVPVASTYGYANQLQNVGKTLNKGFEFQVNAAIIRKPKNNFTWNANFNISTNKNRIEQLGFNQTYFYPDPSWGVSGQPTDYIQRIGDPVGSMWGLVNDGFYTLNDFDYNPATMAYTLKAGVPTAVGIIGVVQPGSIKFKDLNGDGVIDLVNDRQIIGNPTPKFTGGLNQQFTYKQWDLSIFVNFSYGNDIYNANKIELTNAYSNNSNMLDIMAGRWRIISPTGQTTQWVNGSTAYGIAPDQIAAINANATIWQPIKSTGAFYPSSWAIEDGSFLRLNNITLGYSLPVKNLVRMHMSKLRFYLTANNLAILTSYSGYDPEVSVRRSGLTPGLDYSAYPKSRSFIFGINASF